MMIGRGFEDVNVKMPDDTFDASSHEPTFNVYLTAVVRDSEGKIIKVHRQRSHSPTANFIALFLPLSYFTSNNVSATITFSQPYRQLYSVILTSVILYKQQCISYNN